MIVDVHAHVIVPEITRDAGDESWRPDVRWEDGEQVVEHSGRSIRSAVREFVRVEQILDESRGSGVDGVVLSPWVIPDGSARSAPCRWTTPRRRRPSCAR